MKTMKQWLALALAVSLLLTLAACGKNKGKDEDKGATTTTTGSTTTTTTPTTTPDTPDDGLLPDVEADGTEDNPFEIGGVLEFDAVVKAGGVAYYNVYRVGDTYLRIESADATVTYEGKTYEPVEGVITFPVTAPAPTVPVQLIIGNRGDAGATFHVTFGYPEGHRENPVVLQLGDITTQLAAGNEVGMFYTFTATEEGTFTVALSSVTEGVTCDVALLNMNSVASRTLGEDGEDKDGKRLVSVDAKKGDVIQMVVSVERDDKNQYPAATIKTAVSFSAGEVEEVVTDATYTVTVKDKDGAALSGVKLEFSLGGEKKTATTDKNGVATVTMLKADGIVTITMPEGYIGEFVYGISASTPSITITLEKEEPDEPVEPDEPENTTQDYTVTVLNSSGVAAGGIEVSIYNGDTEVARQTTDSQGSITVNLERGRYTVKLSGNAEKYDEKAAVLTASQSDLTLRLGRETTTTEKYWEPISDKNVAMYVVEEGATYVTLTAGKRNYVVFKPTRSGTYRFASSNTSARIGYYGESSWVNTTHPEDVPISGNAFNVSVKEHMLDSGDYTMVIGLDATCDAAVVQITRIGDPEWSIDDEPTVDYTGAGDPKPTTAPTGLVDVDIKSAEEYHLVYNEKDGYYHMGSANGPVVYVRMDNKYVCFLDFFSPANEYKNMVGVLYNADGSFKSKEQYAPLMEKYVNSRDMALNVCALTKDLEHMIRNYCESSGFLDVDKGSYLFAEEEGVNPANAGLFLYCYKA